MQAVLRYFSLLVIPFLLWSAPALAQGTPGDVRPRPLGQAMDAIRAGDWNTAAKLAARDGIVGLDVVRWQSLLVGLGSYEDMQEFLERRPDWPALSRIRRANEIKVGLRRDPVILEHFAQFPARTATGALTHIRALERADRMDEAKALVEDIWKTWRLSGKEQDAYRAAFPKIVAPLHAARLNMLLWRGRTTDAKRMLTLVGKDQKALAEARIALQTRAKGVDSKIEAVPKSLQGHPGLAHDRMQWRLRKGRWDGASEILLEWSKPGVDLGDPGSWARARETLARDTLRDGNAKPAYAMASAHGLTDGSAFAALEWLAGYIALKYLKDPETALRHFSNHDAAVKSPISRGRAGYWKGRALQDMGQPDAAQAEFSEAARHQTSFYGLLAAEAAGLPFDVGLDAVPKTDWRDSDLLQNSVFQAGLLLAASGERTLAEQFWSHLASQLPPDQVALLGQAAIDAGEPHLAVMIGKKFARRGQVVPVPYYPLHPLAQTNLPVDTELALAIARRESEFDPVVISGAGARGLMQLMPRTARDVAGDLGRLKDHTSDRLITDPVYNAELGSTYLAQLVQRFDGNIVMVSAAYNAGPSRPENWMRRFGDPRGKSIEDMVDWIEAIPFDETRNYVMRVAESLPIYRARLGKEPLPQPFSQELLGRSLTVSALADPLPPESE